MSRKTTPLGPMTDSDRIVERLSQQLVTMRQNGTSQTITATEAVKFSHIKTALGGNSHAQRQHMDDVRRIEDKRAAEIEEANKTWAGIRSRLWQAYARHRKAHGCDPARFPHPDDIDICPGKPVRITGPLDAAGHAAMLRTCREIEAHLLQDALDRARTKRRRCPETRPGDPAWVANLLNRTLPLRLRQTCDQVASRRMELASVPLRQLLKQTRRIRDLQAEFTRSDPNTANADALVARHFG